MKEEREIFYVGGEPTASGFGLAGVKAFDVRAENVGEVYGILKDKKAVLILSHPAEKLLGERISELKKNSLTISLPEKPGEEYTKIRSLVRDTLGFELRGL